jgi:hypothetical protein
MTNEIFSDTKVIFTFAGDAVLPLRDAANRQRADGFMVVIGDKVGSFGAYRDGMEIYGRARSEKKELVVLEGWSHYDLYDKPDPIGGSLTRRRLRCGRY